MKIQKVKESLTPIKNQAKQDGDKYCFVYFSREQDQYSSGFDLDDGDALILIKELVESIDLDPQVLIEMLKDQLKMVKAILADEAFLHTNILRGKVPMSRATALHIAGAGDYDELKAENKALRDALQQIRNYRLDATELAENYVFIESWRDVQRFAKDALEGLARE